MLRVQRHLHRLFRDASNQVVRTLCGILEILNKEFNEQTAVKKVREIAGKLGQMYKIQKWTIKDLGGNYKATIQSGGKNVIIGIKRDFNLDLGKYLVSTTFMTNIK